jgi:hypothetical protein
MRASTRLMEPTQLDNFKRYKILCSPQTHNSGYKTLCSFIEERFALLQAAFPSKMKRAPAPSTLWRIIGLVDGGSLEAVFRRHAAMQHAALGGGPGEVVAHDGKSLKGSYDTANEQKMSQLFRAFAVGTKIILGHVAIMVKSNEIPAMQALVRELGLVGVLCTQGHSIQEFR